MVEYYLAAGLIGFGFGWLVGHRPAPEHPMRLVRAFEMTAPVLSPKSSADLGQWDLYITAFAFHANLLGSFAYRPLRAAGVCRRAAWEKYTGLLREAGIVQSGERSATTWAGGWCYPRLRMAIKHKVIALPYPSGDPPPINSPKLSAQIARHGTDAQLAQ